MLKDSFWPKTRVEITVEDKLDDNGEVREELAKDDAFMGQRHDCLLLSFRVGRNIQKYFFSTL